MKETFEKVYIKTEVDLPKGETDSYYAENKDGRKISMFWDAEDKEYSVQVWMRSIVSYLAPQPSSSQPEEIDDEKTYLSAESYIKAEWGTDWLKNEWEAGDVIDALSEFARLFQPKANEQPEEGQSKPTDKAEFSLLFLRINILKYITNEEFIILRDWMNSYNPECYQSKQPEQGRKTMQTSDTCDGCQMFQDCGCMLDDSCPPCFEHSSWIRSEHPEAEYHLVCENCEKTFWSKDAFPKPQFCESCKAPAYASEIDQPREEEYSVIAIEDIDEETVRRWFQRLTGIGVEEMKSDIHAMARASTLNKHLNWDDQPKDTGKDIMMTSEEYYSRKR